MLTISGDRNCLHRSNNCESDANRCLSVAAPICWIRTEPLLIFLMALSLHGSIFLKFTLCQPQIAAVKSFSPFLLHVVVLFNHNVKVLGRKFTQIQDPFLVQWWKLKLCWNNGVCGSHDLYLLCFHNERVNNWAIVKAVKAETGLCWLATLSGLSDWWLIDWWVDRWADDTDRMSHYLRSVSTLDLWKQTMVHISNVMSKNAPPPPIIGIVKVDTKNPAGCKFLHREREKKSICIRCNPHSSVALLNSVQPALSCACTITVSHLYFSPKISPNLFEASLYLSWLSGRLVCSAHTQLCTPALKATSLQMPVLAGDYLSNALWLVRAPGQNHSAEMKLDRLL